MNIYRPLSFILFVERTLSHRSSTIYLSRICCGPINSSSVFRRSLHVSQNNNGIISKKILPDEDGIVKKALRRLRFYMFDNAKLSIGGYLLYETIADKIDYMKFFEEMALPDTFNSWFLVTELHVWMLMCKAMEFGEGGRVIRNKIVAAMWDDVNSKSKKLGAENITTAREQIRILGDQFQAALIAYDEGILSDDRVLAAALWRRFFEKECKNAKALEIMVRYVRQQMEYLDNISEDDFQNCKIVWIPFDKT